MPVAEWMALCNAHYYATRDPLGAAGDFTTAPEISQMFGELIGLCLADLWDRAGRPDAAYVELGPGRGTLARDAARAMAKAGLAPPVHLVETSPVLRAAQRERLPDAVHHDGVAALPRDRALLCIANEFFDALLVRQHVRTEAGWRERVVRLDEGGLAFDIGTTAVRVPIDAQPGAILEDSPASVAIMRDLARRLAAQGGAAIVVDYGYEGPRAGDTLQAVSRHRYADPLAGPGERDLTAHVDFAALAAAARAEGCIAHPLVDQGAFLVALGIDARADALARASGRGEEVAAAKARLVESEAMGRLFRVLCVTAPGWPTPAGLA